MICIFCWKRFDGGQKSLLETRVNSSPRFVVFGIAGWSIWPLISPLVFPSSLLLRWLALFFQIFFYFRYSTLRTFFLDLSFPFTTWELTAHNTSSSNHKMLFLFRIFRSPKLWSSCFIRWRFDRDGYWCANTSPSAVFNDDFLENQSECWKSLARFRTPSTADFHCVVYSSR